MVKLSGKTHDGAGINVSTLKAWARRYGIVPHKLNVEMGPALRTAADMREHLFKRRLLLTTLEQTDMGEDEAMATWAALWMRDHLRQGDGA